MSGFLQRLGPRRIARAEGGTAAVEFAIVFPAFFLLLFGIFEFARMCWAANTLQYAAAKGARYAMVHKPAASACCPSAGAAACPANAMTGMSASITPGLGLNGVTITSTIGTPICSPLPATVQIQVTATYNFTFVISGLGLGPSISLRQQSIVTTPLS